MSIPSWTRIPNPKRPDIYSHHRLNTQLNSTQPDRENSNIINLTISAYIHTYNPNFVSYRIVLVYSRRLSLKKTEPAGGKRKKERKRGSYPLFELRDLLLDR